MYLKKNTEPYKVEERDIYTEFELYEPDFDMIVYHKIKKVEKEGNKGLVRKLKNGEEKSIA
jgi:hypothetical protein